MSSESRGVVERGKRKWLEKARRCRDYVLDSRRTTLRRGVSIIIGILAFGVVLYLGGVDALTRVVSAKPGWLTMVLVATGLMTFTASLRWRALVNSVEGREVRTALDFYHYHMVSKVVGIVATPNVGDIGARPISMGTSGAQSFRRALFCSFLDKLLDLWLLVLFSGPVILYSLGLISIQGYFGLLVGLVGVGSVLACKRFQLLLKFFFDTVETVTALASAAPILGQLVDQGAMPRTPRLRETVSVDSNVATSALAITVFKHVTMVLRAYSVSEALSLNMPLWVMFFAMPVVQASMVLSFTPAGLGIQELGWYGAFALAGIDRSRATVFLIGQRAYVFLSIITLALLTHIAAALTGERT